MKISIELNNIVSSTIDRLVFFARNDDVPSFLDYPNNIVGDLYVRFNNEQEYIYKKVPLDKVTKIITAESIGSTFNAIIVKGNYSFEKI